MVEGRARGPAYPLYQVRGRSGSEYACEILNLVEGERTVSARCNAPAAIHGPVPLALVAEYFGGIAIVRWG